MSANNPSAVQHGKKKRFRLIPFIVSLLLSFILWNYVMMVESPTREMSFEAIPITIVKGDNPLAVISGGGATVNITVSGKKSQTGKLSKENISVIADISDTTRYPTAGEYKKIPLRVDIPKEVSLVEQSVSYVTLYLDEMATKSVQIKTVFPGSQTYDDFCTLGTDSVELSQSEINVSGPLSVISRIDCAQLTIPLNGHIDSSRTFSGTPVFIDRDGTEVVNPYISSDVSSVSGTVPLFMTKELPLTVDFKYGYLSAENVRTEPETVQVSGKIENVKELESYTVTTVDEKKLTPTFTATLPVLDGVSVIGAPESVSVSVDTRGLAEKTLLISGIKVSNPNSLAYALDSDSISVTLIGRREAVSAVTADDVTVTADLSGISSLSADTKQTAAVTVSLSDAYSGTVWEKGEYSVVVTQAK